MIDLIIASQKNTKEYKNIEGVKLPSVYGEMEVLTNHAKAFIILKKGEVIIKKSENNIEKVEIGKGECYIRDNIVSVLL